MRLVTTNILLRFSNKIQVDNNTNCWNWIAAKHSAGYGLFILNNKRIYSHRYSYELFKGKIYEGLDIDHICRNRLCCNPDHLEAVTRQVNLLRGMGTSAINARKIKCPRGHNYTGKNNRGQRICGTCKNEKANLFYQEYCKY